MTVMRNFFILLLLFSVGCKDGGSNDTSDGSAPIRTSQDQDSAPSADSDSTTDTSPDVSYPVYDSPLISDTWTREFMTLVNNHRTSMGLHALIHNEELADIVRAHSEDMASGRVAFGHTGFSTRCSLSRSVLGGGNWCGENVAMGQKTPSAAFTAWMNSSGHRANIESSRATHTGFGYAKSGSGTYYWTQIFIER